MSEIYNRDLSTFEDLFNLIGDMIEYQRSELLNYCKENIKDVSIYHLENIEVMAPNKNTILPLVQLNLLSLGIKKDSKLQSNSNNANTTI